MKPRQVPAIYVRAICDGCFEERDGEMVAWTWARRHAGVGHPVRVDVERTYRYGRPAPRRSAKGEGS